MSFIVANKKEILLVRKLEFKKTELQKFTISIVSFKFVFYFNMLRKNSGISNKTIQYNIII